MSLHTQLLRGLMALPVAVLLIVAGALSPAQSVTVACDRANADVAPALPRTADFQSTLPGALHVVKRVKVGEG